MGFGPIRCIDIKMNYSSVIEVIRTSLMSLMLVERILDFRTKLATNEGNLSAESRKAGIQLSGELCPLVYFNHRFFDSIINVWGCREYILYLTRPFCYSMILDV